MLSCCNTETFPNQLHICKFVQGPHHITCLEGVYERMGLVAKWLACPSTTPTTRVRILQFLQVHPGSRLPINPAVHPFEVGKWVNDVSCRMLAGEMAQWFKCSLSQTSQWLSYTQCI
ncbi:hypothetical protein HELRODRAFT_159108 [Helobdella robusta]|uniref:Uncharacterized protein n=1 Tax=Helobdella robusta TaxID=6412 RepID=T1ENL7_HELRO|nr:hypothetical protein HELRODRAFT_159108 [Helobdella robusta]ESO12549.1 hypothetical protein HELRODRAFT_159108 [Helobdella robusta]